MTTQLPEARFVSAMSSINPFKHTAATLNYLRRQSPEVILFYSGGKDSLVLLDLMAPHFRKIYCVFMYLIKDLDHIQPFMSWVKRYNNAELYQYPHWILAHYLKSNFYCIPRSIDAPPIKIFKMADIEEKVRQKTGCEWIVYGNKQADSLNRRLMLRQYKFDAINEKNKKAYPLSLWSKAQVKRYISLHQIINPVDYGGKNSNGVSLSLHTFLWLRENYPQDLEKIFKVFPFARKLLFEYDYEQKHRK